MKKLIFFLFVLLLLAGLALVYLGYFPKHKAEIPIVTQKQLDAGQIEDLRNGSQAYWQDNMGETTPSAIISQPGITTVSSIAGGTNVPTSVTEKNVEDKAIVTSTEKVKLSIEGNYALSLGAFSSQANAERYKTKLAAKGFSTQVRLGKSGNWLVILNQGWATKQEAAREQKRLRNNGTKSVIVWGF